MRQEDLLENKLPVNKAIFMAGIPGSGKSTIASSFTGMGFKIIDVDQVFRLFQKRGQTIDYDTDYATLDAPRKKKLAFLSSRKMNLIIDGTGRSITSVEVINQKLLELGYNTAMIYVTINTSTAIHNAIRREFQTGRAVSTDYINDVASKLNENIPIFKQMFGYTNFFTIATDHVDFSKSMHLQFPPSVNQRLTRFLKSPI